MGGWRQKAKVLQTHPRTIIHVHLKVKGHWAQLKVKGLRAQPIEELLEPSLPQSTLLLPHHSIVKQMFSQTSLIGQTSF